MRNNLLQSKTVRSSFILINLNNFYFIFFNAQLQKKLQQGFNSQNQLTKMYIQLDEQYKKLCYIQTIKPGKLNTCSIIISIFLTVLTLGVPILIYLKCQRFKNFIHHIVFEQVQKDTQQVNHYLIVDSKIYSSELRSIEFRNYIIKPYIVQSEQKLKETYKKEGDPQQFEICKYIQHKNLRYLIKDNTLYSLKLSLVKPFQEYFRQGLTSSQANRSLEVFGKPGNFQISFYHILKKIIYQKSLRFIFMLFTIKKIVVGFVASQNEQPGQLKSDERLVSTFILVQILLTLVMTLGISIYGAREHNKIHKQLQDKKYQVLRNGQVIEVNLNDLYVGDLVIPEIGQIIYFKGLIAADSQQSNYVPYVIVNQKLYNRIDEPIQKTVLLSHLNQVSQAHVINPGAQILNMSVKQSPKSLIFGNKINEVKEQSITGPKLRQIALYLQEQDQRVKRKNKFYIIVADNSFLQKYYTCYKESNYFNNFSFLRSKYDSQQIVFQAIFLAVAIIGTFWVLGQNRSNEHWFDILISHIVICFPFNLAMFCNVSEVLSMIRLKGKGISTVNPCFEQLGIVDSLSLQMSVFQKMQFSGFVKKQRCTRMPLPQRFQDSQGLFDIFRRARQQSIFSFLIWAGMMNLPHLQRQPIYKEIFQKYDFLLKQKSLYEQDTEQRRAVINRDDSTIRIDWKQYQRFPISQKLVETLIIEDLYANKFQDRLVIISQGYFTHEKCQDYFDQLMTEQGKTQFKSAIRRLFIQGRKIKYISLRRNFIKNEKDLQIKNFRRQDIQKKLKFGGFLIFDQWPTQQSMNSFIQLDQLSGRLNMSIFSVRPQNALNGYDHTLRNIKIYYQQQSSHRTDKIYTDKMQHSAVGHVGNGILDQSSLLLSDVSINKTSDSYGQADFQINNPKDILDILYESFSSLYNTTITVVCLVLFNFSKIIGQLFIYTNGLGNKLQASPFAQGIDRFFIVEVGALILPILLLNIYQPTRKLVRRQNRQFFRIQLVFNVVVVLSGLLALYGIQFLDYQSLNVSQIKDIQGIQHIKSHYFTSRAFLNQHQHDSPIQSPCQNQYQHDSHIGSPCQGLIPFINISFALLVILLVDRQTLERKSKNLFFGIINKLYMFLLWVWSVFYFNIPSKNVIRASVVILVLTLIVWILQWIRQKKAEEQDREQEIPEIFTQN